MISVTELSPSVVQGIVERVARFSAVLFRKNADGKAPCRSGSCTLARVGDRLGFLTAAHVYDQLREASETGVSAIDGGELLWIGTDALNPFIAGRRACAPWGPDLAFLAIPRDLSAKIEAYSKKAFYDLCNVPRAIVALPEDTVSYVMIGVWGLCGGPVELSVTSGPMATQKMGPFLGSVTRVHVGAVYDFLDMHVCMNEGSDLPSTFQGMSGGGLWQFPVSMDADEQKLDQAECPLQGVAFYEGWEGEKRFVRSHGPKSLLQLIRTVQQSASSM